MTGLSDRITSTSPHYEYYVVNLTKYDNGPSDVLEKNRENIAKHIGDDNYFIEFFGDAIDKFCDNAGLEFADLNTPALAVIEDHPAEIGSDNNLILFEIGDLHRDSEITELLEIIFSKLKSDDFYELAWDSRRREIERSIEDADILSLASLSLKLITI